MLTKNEAEILLDIARQAITAQIQGEDYAAAPREEKALNERLGCFVTIKQHGHLRGCIGNFQARQPLYREVAQMAVASASQDPRFEPLQAAELDDCSLELTILSPLEKVAAPEMIEVGQHGIYIEQGFHRGVLLPQVATEHGWDRETFLRQTCLKAGLPENAWQSPDADIYVFNGFIYAEAN